MTTKVNWGGQTYVSPEVISVEIHSEGILCGSTLLYDSPSNGYGSNDLGDI